MSKSKIVVTGANGFIGKALICHLVRQKKHVLAITRRSEAGMPCETAVVGEVGPDTKWGNTLVDADCIIHLAGRAHVLQDPLVDPFTEYHQTNVLGTAKLAQDAASEGVRRFIFISSIGVNGNCNTKPFSEDDAPNPVEPYAVSKREAEIILEAIAADTGMEVVTIRPPLVYGPNAPGNFGRIVKVVAGGIPLPFGAVKNKRSLVFLENLVDLIITCIDHPSAANRTFLVSDGQDISTPGLIRGLAAAMDKSALLLPVPRSLLRLGGRLTGRLNEVERLVGSLQVNISTVCEALGWSPPIPLAEGLRRTVKPRIKSDC